MTELRNPLVRDLAAVLAAPGMLATELGGRNSSEIPELLAQARSVAISDAECAELLAQHRAELLALDSDPSALETWLTAGDTSHLLGRYFETLSGYWIRHLLAARRFAQSIKVLRGKQTMGELDFVFEDAQGELQHWEVSVKFYLCTADAPQGGLHANSFLGTMTRDRLDKKFARVFSHQLPMPESPEGQEALRAAGFGDAPLRTRLLMKGALFYPYASGWRTHPHPPEVSPAHLRGWWSKELPEGEAWVVLDRRKWLSPFFAESQYVPLSRKRLQQQLAAHFEESRMAFMLAAVEQGADGAWREAHRGLVVHHGWPWPVTSEAKNPAEGG